MNDLDPDAAAAGGPPPAPGAVAPPLPNLLVRIGQLFGSPGALFDALRENPAWLGAMLFLVALALLTNFLIPEAAIRQEILRRAGEHAAEMQGQLDRMMKFARISRYVGAVIGPAIGALVVSGILILLFNVLMGGEARFRQLFSATTHTMLLPAIGQLFVAFLIRRKGSIINFSLGLFLPGSHAGYLGRLLEGLSVFGIWGTVLLGIAVSRLYRKRTAGSSIALLLGIYVVLKALFALRGGP